MDVCITASPAHSTPIKGNLPRLSCEHTHRRAPLCRRPLLPPPTTGSPSRPLIRVLEAFSATTISSRSSPSLLWPCLDGQLTGAGLLATTAEQHRWTPSLAPPQPWFWPPSDSWWSPCRFPHLPGQLRRRPCRIPARTAAVRPQGPNCLRLFVSMGLCAEQGYFYEVSNSFGVLSERRFLSLWPLVQWSCKFHRNSRKNQKNVIPILLVSLWRALQLL
jgi:hypothetical protein